MARTIGNGAPDSSQSGKRMVSLLSRPNGPRCWIVTIASTRRVTIRANRRLVAPHPKSYFSGIAHEMADAGHSTLWGGADERGLIRLPFTTICIPRAGYHTGCSTEAGLCDWSKLSYVLEIDARCEGGGQAMV